MARLRPIATGIILIILGLVLDIIRGYALKFDIIILVGIIVLVIGLLVK